MAAKKKLTEAERAARDIAAEKEALRISQIFADADVEMTAGNGKTISQIASRFIQPKEVIKSTDALSEYIADTKATANFSDYLQNPFRKSLALRVSLTMDSENLSLSSKISAFDRDIIEAICSLYFANSRNKGTYKGDFIFSAASVYRVIFGLDKLEKASTSTGNTRYRIKASQTALKQIDDCIMRLMGVRLDIEMDDKGTDGYNRTISGAVLPLERVLVSMKGIGSTSAYRLISAPILLKYGFFTNTLACVSIKQNKLPETISKTPYNIATRSVLLSACLTASMMGLDHTKVPYDAIYEQRNATDNRQKIRARDTVMEILNYWKSDENHLIHDYSEYYDRKIQRAPLGIEIVFLPEQIKRLDRASISVPY